MPTRPPPHGATGPRRPARLAAVLLAAGLASTSAPARAQVRELRSGPPADLTVTIVSSALFAASLFVEPRIAPTDCRWCEPPSADAAVRNALVWREPATADDFSNVTGFLFAPTAAFGLDALAAAHDHASRGVGVDALVILEATVLALDVTEATKLLVARERPFLHEMPKDDRARWKRTADDYLSFFSGHTASTFALAAASGTVATMRGYRWAPLPWAFGGALAAGTGYLRIGADRHWLTDVLVGMVAGIAIGVAVPLALHSPPGG